jgi:hypothetical protein
MRERLSDVIKSQIRFNRAVLAAGAALTVAVATGAYAVYRAGQVMHGLKETVGSATSIYENPGDFALPGERSLKP